MTRKPSNFHSLRRRSFLKGVLATGALSLASPNLLLGAPGDKVRLACVGIGNRGADVVRGLHRTGLAEIVALCDTQVGAKHTLGVLEDFPEVPQFQDFRKMFEKLGGQIDAVSVATPDHSHFPAAMLAMSLGKHVYCEKPMAHSFRQIELMMAAEKKYKVACQMGNQGHSDANYFQFKTWVEQGVIKNVTKITAFMNDSRRWHGMQVSDYLPEQPIPENLDWNGWIATAQQHQYNRGYTNGDWRSWFEFGNGALGDWGAHIFDTAHEFLELGLPVEVEPKLQGWNPFIFPQASTLAFRFPKRGSLPPVELTWYDGPENLPPLPEGFDGTSGARSARRLAPGKLIYGEGRIFKGGTHGATLQILGEPPELMASLPPVPESPSNHFKNFLLACRGEEQCRSSFAVAGPLCQAMALGIIAQRVNAKVVFDLGTKRITNHKVADALLDGPPPRPEWEQYYKL